MHGRAKHVADPALQEPEEGDRLDQGERQVTDELEQDRMGVDTPRELGVAPERCGRPGPDPATNVAIR